MSKRVFTLVELIIVITILAILSVSAFLVVSQRIGKSRDSRRLSDLNTIEKALGVSLTSSQRYPLPDNYVTVYISGTAIGYQGKFCDTATAATSIKSSPKDPLDNGCYTYYTTTGGKNYQLMGMLENSSTVTFRGIGAQGPRSTVNYQEDLQFSNSACTCNSNGTNSICSVASLAFCLNYAHASEVSAADYSVRIPTTKGETLGIIVMSGTNQLLEETGTGVDLATSSLALKSVFSSTEISSGTGGQLIFKVINKNPGLNTSTTLASFDSSLVGYRDMHTFLINGGLNMVKDLSQYQNHGSCYNGGTIVSCGSPGQGPQLVQGNKKGLYFDGVDDYIDFSSFSGHTGYPTMTWCAGYSNYLSSGANILFSKGGAYRMMAYNNPQIAISTVNNGWYTTGTYFDLGSGNRITPLSTRIYLCFVYDGAYIRAYRDGKYLNSNGYALSGAVGSAVSSFRMAWKDSANTAFYNGEIDEVRIYNRALSDSEIFDLYK